MTSITQQQTLNAVQVLLSAGVPVLLWGDPGTGKTQTVERFAQQAGWHMESIIASLHEPTDFGGLPVRSNEGVTFEPPAWARRVVEHDGPSPVFFDEVNTATPATQNALMRVVLEARVGELHLGDDVCFVAAANPPSQNAGAWDLSAPLANRFGHLDWPVAQDEWRDGFMADWPCTAPLQIADSKSMIDKVNRAKSLVVAFLAARPELLSAVPDADLAASRGWPSPRSWDNLARCQAICEDADAGDEVRLLIATALVGAGTAIEYMTYARDLDLFDPLDLLADPSSFAQIERTDQQFAALEAVAASVGTNPKKHWHDGFKVCIAAAQAGGPDVAAAVASRLMATKPSGARLPKGFEVFSEILNDAGLLDRETKSA